jgi:tetratricopeptide (TPR) repeat protein
MSAAIPIHKHTVGRTFMVAITVLGLGAFVQFCAVSWLFFSRYRSAPVELPGTAANPPPAGARQFSDPFADPTPAAANLPVATTPPRKPIPMPLNQTRTLDSARAERVAARIEQGRALRERGESYASVTLLREAVAMDEENPQPLAELAITYEKMGFAEKAAECWKAIYEMGEAAGGVYFAAAEARRKAGQEEALKHADPGTPAPAPAPTEPGAAAVTPNAGVSVVPEKLGLKGDSKFGLLDITRADEASDTNTKRKFVLHIPIKARPRVRIDPHDVLIQVTFYDIVNGKALDRTSANVSHKYTNPPCDWADEDVEALEVTYQLPELRVTDEDRKYYGYIVSLYYRNALQDYKSDPPALAQKAVPPATLAQDAP